MLALQASKRMARSAGVPQKSPARGSRGLAKRRFWPAIAGRLSSRRDSRSRRSSGGSLDAKAARMRTH
jgi:hypothetical protein